MLTPTRLMEIRQDAKLAKEIGDPVDSAIYEKHVSELSAELDRAYRFNRRQSEMIAQHIMRKCEFQEQCG